MTENTKYMKIALKEADKAEAIGEVPIGAVIVKEGRVVSKAYNLRERTNQAVGHAEMIAIRKANKKLGSWRLDDCDMYVTIEPCPMCAGAIIQARIRTLYFGAHDPKTGACGSVFNLFEDHKWCHTTKIGSGILEKECGKKISDFFKELREKKQF